MWCKQKLANEIDMKDNGLLYYFGGLEVWQGEGEVFLGQGKYSMDIFQIFQMFECKPSPLLSNK